MLRPPPSFPPVLGESGGQRIARIVRAYAGCSLSSRLDELQALVDRGVCDPSIVGLKTNCATFALGVLAAAGCPHPLLARQTAVGAAFSELVTLGDDLGAWRVWAPSEALPVGALLWYEIAGQNDDHAEFLLEPGPPPTHGGGGRMNNAITVGQGDVALSWGRPVHRWLDPDALGLPDAAAPTDPRPIPVPDSAHADTLPPPAPEDA